MKIEIVKETLIDGEIRYSIEKDGTYVPNSVHRDLEKVRQMYERMLIIGNDYGTIKEILQTTEI